MIVLLPIALATWAIVDIARAATEQVRGMTKAAWITLALFVPVIGPGMWFWLGRPREVVQESTLMMVPPDDNPEFLRDLDRELRWQRRRRGEE